MRRDVAALTALLAAERDAWVAAVGPEGLYVPMPATVPLTRVHRRLTGRWALDHVVAGDHEPLSALWRDLASTGHGHGAMRVRLVTGGAATFHLFKVADDLGVDVLVALAEHDADLSAPPSATDLAMSSRFTRVLRDEAGRTIEVDGASAEVLGWSDETLLSRDPPLDRVHPDDRDRVLENWVATLNDATTGHRSRIRLQRSDGTFRWCEMTNFNRLDDPIRPHVVSEFLDITEEMAAHDAVRAREQLLYRLAEALPLGVLQLDLERRIVYKNDFLGTIIGLDEAATMAEQFVDVVADDRPLLEGTLAAALEDGADGDIIIRMTPEGALAERLIRVITKSLPNANGLVACISDVTEVEQRGRELAHRATFDALTGCLNRASIVTALEVDLALDQGSTAVVFVDLDGFKAVNDRCGHSVGDDVLRAAASLLDETTRHDDSVGRIGGDEFLVVCPDVDSEVTALELATRISAAIGEHPIVSGADEPMQASIGVAWSDRADVSADELVERADAAMYASKREGAGVAHLWRAEVSDPARLTRPGRARRRGTAPGDA